MVLCLKFGGQVTVSVNRQNSSVEELNSDKSSEIIEVDWKKALQESTEQAQGAIQYQKKLSMFCEEMRTHCPETNWLFINPGEPSQKSDTHLQALETWIKAMVASPLWPFPETLVILSGSKDDSFDWRIVVPKNSRPLPQALTHRSISASAFEDSHSVGFEVKAKKTFTVDRVGNA